MKVVKKLKIFIFGYNRYNLNNLVDTTPSYYFFYGRDLFCILLFIPQYARIFYVRIFVWDFRLEFIIVYYVLFGECPDLGSMPIKLVS